MTMLTPDSTTIAASELESMTSVVDVIETVIASLDSSDTAMVNRGEDGSHTWKFQYGTAEVFVKLTGLTDEDLFTVWAKVLSLPARDEAQLTRQLLEMNWSDTLEARFAIADDQVVVLASRTLAELSPGEISRSITIVATIADDQDEPLQAKFGQP